jgi:mono/diheme cytochrome c family protein
MAPVKHVAVTLAAAILLAGGWTQSAQAQGAPDGAKLYASRCGDCHGVRAIAAWGRKEPDAARRRAWLDSLLRRHHAPPDADRDAIVAYVETVIAGRK